MALTPEIAPFVRNPTVAPASDIRPSTGVYYDIAGTPHISYLFAPPPPGVASGGGVAAPSSFAAVTPSDTTPLPAGTQSLWVGGVGNLVVKGLDGVTATFTAVPAGTLIRGQFSRVMAATTATLIVAMA